MKDIDFDELDRAVTSALNASGAGLNQSSEQVSVRSLDSNKSSVEMNPNISSHTGHTRMMSSGGPGRTTLARKPVVTSRASTSITEAIEVTKAPVPAVSPVKRSIPHREGRFMDVVRPGVKPTLSAAVVPESVEASVSVEADELTVVPEVTESESAAPNPHNASLEAAINNLFVSEGHNPVESSTTVDLVETPVVEAPSMEELTTEVEFTPAEDVATDEIAAELGMPLEEMRSNSPFIPDAKVEKRPLGEIEQLDSIEMSQEPVVEDAIELLSEINEAPSAPVPEELTSDLAAIESHETNVENIENIVETPISEEVQEETAAPEAVVGPTSIARQYKEQPRTASEDDESGAIFDPQTYQPPVEHPAKKSSGWGWVIACVLIIILATVAGVVAWIEGLLPVPL